MYSAFYYTISDDDYVNVPAGYLSWGDLHKIHEEDQKLPAHLRKAPDLSYKSLHPGDNKQSVPLTLAIFSPTTMLEQEDIFLKEKILLVFLN